MATTEGFRLKVPPHPGAFVRSEIIEPAELTVAEASKVLGVTRQALSTFLNGRASLSPEMAIRLEKAFGVSMDTLMRMQNSFDIAEARKRQDEIVVAPYVAKADTRPGLA